MPNVFRKTYNRGKINVGSRQTRIVIPQPVKRPIHLMQRTFVHKADTHPNPWWWILHRRGLARPKVGADPLEARAVPKSLIRGTLPERILFKKLLDLHMVDGIDFSFQSSLEGGRLELGGIVVDFLFPLIQLVIQVQGPTHTQFLRMKKDEEQRQILAAMGLTVTDLYEDEIYNEPVFEMKIRQIFNLGTFRWGGAVEGYIEAPVEDQLSDLYCSVTRAEIAWSNLENEVVTWRQSHLH